MPEHDTTALYRFDVFNAGVVYVLPVPLGISVQVETASGRVCHCIVQVPVPPVYEAVKTTPPPTHIVDSGTEAVTIGSVTTVVIIVVEVTLLQPLPV